MQLSPCTQWVFDSLANVDFRDRKWMCKWSELLMEEMHLAIWKFMLYGMFRYIDWEVVNGISKECSAVSTAKWYQSSDIYDLW